jgi:hypothetical protein
VARFPFNLDADKYSRQLWDKATYLYMAEFFRCAQFDANKAVVAGFTIDDYRHSGSDSATEDLGTSDWRLPCGAGSEYASYFKVIDASTYDANGAATACKIGVTDGGWLDEKSDPTNCGSANVNGVAVPIPVFDKELSNAGQYWIWRHSWIASGADGEKSEIIVGDPDDETPPDNPNGGIAFWNTALGRCIVGIVGGKATITGITQDYYHSGSDPDYLYGDCDGGTVLT